MTEPVHVIHVWVNVVHLIFNEQNSIFQVSEAQSLKVKKKKKIHTKKSKWQNLLPLKHMFSLFPLISLLVMLNT